MSFIRRQGSTKTQYLPVTPSTALSANSLVTLTSGKLVAAVAATTAMNIAGVLQKAIVATDTDYATDRLVPVDVPVERHVVWLGDVTSGLVAGDIGKECDLTDANTVNRAATTIGIARCVSVINTTKGEFYLKINGSY